LQRGHRSGRTEPTNDESKLFRFWFFLSLYMIFSYAIIRLNWKL